MVSRCHFRGFPALCAPFQRWAVLRIGCRAYPRFGIVSGRFLTLMFVLFLSVFLALQDLRKIAFHGMQLLDTGFFLPVFVVMGVLFGGKLLDFRLQGFMAWQLGNAMRPKITGGCVRYDKIAFVPFPVGAAGFFRFLRFQTVTGRLGLGIGKRLCLKFLFLPDSSVQAFSLAVLSCKSALADTRAASSSSGE